jgi:hypothetical protein
MMKKILSLLSAGALAISMVAPAAAGGDTDMTPHPFAPGRSFHPGNLGNPGFSDVRRFSSRHHWSGGHRYHHHHRGFYRYGGYGWYNGYRGYRYYRPGYREYNGWWFPAAVLGGLGAAIIGNAIVNSNHGGSAHVQWCYDHYRSYRASDNTYQPYNGPRRQCVSPYG